MEEKRIEELTQLLQEELDFKRRQRERRMKREAREKKAREKKRTVFCLLFSTAIISTATSLIAAFTVLFSAKPDDIIAFTPKVEVIVNSGTESKEDMENKDTVELAATPQIIIQSESVTISLTEDTSRGLFEQVMAAESYGFWSEQDILSLATVVMNRVKSPDFPNTVEEVLMQDKQFTTYLNGRYKNADITDECRQAVSAALDGKTNLNANVLWFCTKEYYDAAPDDDFFKTLNHVYTCRNVYFFEE